MMLLARRLSSSPPPPSPAPLLRRLSSHHPPPPPPPKELDSGSGGGAAPWARRAAALSLLGLTGAVAASALDDLSVFLSCSSQAIEKAAQNHQIAGAIGEPIVRGHWYSASLAVNHARRSVSCTFPVAGPRGNGILRLKAVRLGDESWFSFLRRGTWEILLMDAILDVPTADGNRQTIRVTIPDNTTPPPSVDCNACQTPQQPPPPAEK